MMETKLSKCPSCKMDIPTEAEKCPYCQSDLSFEKHPVRSFLLYGLMMVSFGLFFLWLPFIGIPLILIGLLFLVFGLLGGLGVSIEKLAKLNEKLSWNRWDVIFTKLKKIRKKS